MRNHEGILKSFLHTYILHILNKKKVSHPSPSPSKAISDLSKQVIKEEIQMVHENESKFSIAGNQRHKVRKGATFHLETGRDFRCRHTRARALPNIGGGALKGTTRSGPYYCLFGRQFRNTSQKP